MIFFAMSGLLLWKVLFLWHIIRSLKTGIWISSNFLFRHDIFATVSGYYWITRSIYCRAWKPYTLCVEGAVPSPHRPAEVGKGRCKSAAHPNEVPLYQRFRTLYGQVEARNVGFTHLECGKVLLNCFEQWLGTHGSLPHTGALYPKVVGQDSRLVVGQDTPSIEVHLRCCRRHCNCPNLVL